MKDEPRQERGGADRPRQITGHLDRLADQDGQARLGIDHLGIDRLSCLPRESACSEARGFRQKDQAGHDFQHRRRGHLRSGSGPADEERRQSETETRADGSPEGPGKRRSEFARRAAEIGRGITGTTAKLQRLAECKYQISKITMVIMLD